MPQGGISALLLFAILLGMNLLLIANSAHIGGGNRSLLLLARALSARGHKVLIVLPSPGPMIDACGGAEVECVVMPRYQLSWASPVRSCGDQWRWTRLLRGRRIEMIHANDPVAARPVLLPARMHGIPVVVHIRFPLHQRLISWVFRYLPKPNALVFNSHALQAECGPQFLRAARNARQYVIHNAVDLEDFRPIARAESKTRVGILANLVRVKGHVDFLRMARLVLDQGIGAEFWIIGGDIHGDEYGQELEKLSLELRLDKHVRFLGHCDNIPRLLNDLDVVVCASHVEPFGRCLIEAMACGKPVVATKVGGIPEVVDDGVTGTLVPPNSPRLLADAVVAMLESGEGAKSMGAAGRQRVERLFSVNSHIESVLRVYEWVLANASGMRRGATFQESC